MRRIINNKLQIELFPYILNYLIYIKFRTACVTGLSKLRDDFLLIGIGNVQASWTVLIPKISLDTTYFMDLLLKTDSEHLIEGSGPLEASVENVFFTFQAEGKIPLNNSQPIRLDTLDVNFGFSNLQLSLDNSTYDNSPIDWQEAVTGIEDAFYNAWTGNDPFRGLVNGIVRCFIDHVVNVSFKK